MTLASFSPVILAAFLHAAWNLMTKRAAGGGPVFVCACALVATVAYAPWALWVLLRAEPAWSWPLAGAVLASGLIHLAYSLCLQRGYQVADLSVVYPVARGTGPLLASLGAVLFLSEVPTGLRLVGLLGIGLVSTQGDLGAFRRPGGQAGVLWGGATGRLIAAYTVVDAYAVKALGAAPVVLNWLTTLLRLALLAVPVARDPARARQQMRGRWRLAIGVGLVSPLSHVLVLAALDMGAPLSVVAPVRESSMMMGALLGMAVLHEPVGRWRLLGCVVLVGGVVLLGASG